jgi:hypothetical protein
MPLVYQEYKPDLSRLGRECPNSMRHLMDDRQLGISAGPHRTDQKGTLCLCAFVGSVC